MERVGEWRMIDADEPDTKAEPARPGSAGAGVGVGVGWRAVAALVGAAVLGVAGVAIWVTLPQGGVTLDVAGQSESPPPVRLPAVAALPTAAPALVVDVEGAVVRPGVHALPAGSRVGDAISAAGGYSTQVDIAAAAEALNLAEPISDGDKIHVPARGEG